MSERTSRPLVVGDHLRPRDETHPGGVYRVVGTGDSITLLRVTDERDRRRATGEIVSVPWNSVSAFEPAGDPDTGFRPVAWLHGLLSWAYWMLRMALDWLLPR